MKQPNLMVGKIIRKKHFKKRVRKPTTSRSVRYFNSLQNRCPQLSIQETVVYEKWTANIRESMEKDNVWPTGLEVWTQELVSEYIKRLQIEFWRSTKVKEELLSGNKYYVITQIIEYPRSDYPDARHLLRVFRAIYKLKIRRYVRRSKICNLNHWRWFVTPVCTASYTLDWKPKNIIRIHCDEYP